MKTSPLEGLKNYPQELAEGSYRTKQAEDFKHIFEKAKLEGQDDQKLKEACQEFEAFFLHKMLQQMRSSIPGGGLLGESHASKIYKDMLDEQYSKLIARSHGSIGLADLLYRHYTNYQLSTTNNQPSKSPLKK